MQQPINERMTVTPQTLTGKLLALVEATPGWTVRTTDHGVEVEAPDKQFRSLSMAMSGDNEEDNCNRVAALLKKIGFDVDIETFLEDDEPVTNKSTRVVLNPDLFADIDRERKKKGPGEVITPAKAKAILERHEKASQEMQGLEPEQWEIIEKMVPPGGSLPPVRNRKIDKRHIRLMKEAIGSTGFPKDTLINISPGIVVEGKLIGKNFLTDGQHRLLSLMQLGNENPRTKPGPWIKCIVNDNASLFDFDHLDSGKSRGFQQTEYAHGRKTNTQTTSVTSMVTRIARGDTHTVSWMQQKIPNSYLRATVAAFPDIQFGVIASRANSIKNRASGHMSVAAIGTTLIMAPIVWPDSPIDEFYDIFTSSNKDILASKHPHLFLDLRDYFHQYVIKTSHNGSMRTAGNNKSQAVHLHMLITAYNLYCQMSNNEDVPQLKMHYKLPRSSASGYSVPGFYHPKKGKRETLHRQVMKLRETGRMPTL